MIGAIGEAAQHVVEPLFVGLGEVVQHVARHELLAARMANAKADAGVLGADVLVAGSAVFKGGSVKDPAPYGENIRAIRAAAEGVYA